MWHYKSRETQLTLTLYWPALGHPTGSNVTFCALSIPHWLDGFDHCHGPQTMVQDTDHICFVGSYACLLGPCLYKRHVILFYSSIQSFEKLNIWNSMWQIIEWTFTTFSWGVDFFRRVGGWDSQIGKAPTAEALAASVLGFWATVLSCLECILKCLCRFCLPKEQTLVWYILQKCWIVEAWEACLLSLAAFVIEVDKYITVKFAKI